MSRLAILGAGGHGKVVADTAEATGRWDSIAFFDGKWPELQHLDDWPVLGQESDLLATLGQFDGVVIAIGHNATRLHAQQRLQQSGARLTTIVHPQAWVSPRATLGEGSVVFAGAVIQAGVALGEACIVNTAASVDHDCILGAGTHISPGARLGGTVILGERCWIGIGSSLRNNISLGADCTVGAGAAVITSAGEALTLVGVPAHPLSR